MNPNSGLPRHTRDGRDRSRSRSLARDTGDGRGRSRSRSHRTSVQSSSRERSLAALASLDQAELADLLEEQGSITMDCEFCNQQYRFERDDLAPMLGDNGSKTLH